MFCYSQVLAFICYNFESLSCFEFKQCKVQVTVVTVLYSLILSTIPWKLWWQVQCSCLQITWHIHDIKFSHVMPALKRTQEDQYLDNTLLQWWTPTTITLSEFTAKPQYKICNNYGIAICTNVQTVSYRTMQGIYIEKEWYLLLRDFHCKHPQASFVVYTV